MREAWRRRWEMDGRSIHRGTYRTRPPRRSFDIIYGWPGPCLFAVPEPTCFADASILKRLTPPARRFFERFIDAHRSEWEERQVTNPPS